MWPPTSWGVEFAEWGKRDTELFVDAREAERLGVQHHGQVGGREGTEDFLAFAEAVAEECGGRALRDSALAEFDELRGDFGFRWENIARQRERRLHDERIGAGRGARFGGEAGTELEVAGVEQ